MITCEDVLQYEHLASMVPAFVLQRMAKRNSNLVSKFESKIKPRLENLSEDHKNKLNFALNSNVSDLQKIMDEAFKRTDKKQFEILANPDNAEFIEINLDELRKLLS